MKIPLSTYRVQLNSSFTFRQLIAIIPYLYRLGITTIYASPVTAAVPGSTHGYDVTEPGELNPEIGTMDEFRQIAAQLNGLGMTWLQDIVPNHMAFSTANQRLMDVLERGERSPYYRYFDISWQQADKALCGKVMLPVLAEERADCIDKSQIQLQWRQQGPVMVYAEQAYPVAPGIYEYLLPVALPYWRNQVDMLYSYWTAPLPQWIQYKQQLAAEVMADGDILQYVQQRVNEINSNRKELRKWLDCQCYVLACWTYADTQMNYRRFFAVNSLISLRMEDPSVFKDYHRLIGELYSADLIQGIRIDHIDGLYDPQGYIEQLKVLLGNDCYVIAEKILEYNEALPRDWNLEGTSGYEFLSFTNQLLTDREGAAGIRDFYSRWVSETVPYEDLVFEKKYTFLGTYLGGEWDALVRYLETLQVLQGVAYTREKLKKALGVWMAAFPVYRIYARRFPIAEQELLLIRRAFTIAGIKAPDCTEELEVLQTLFESSGDPERDAAKMQFIMRVMQFTGPLAAKGVEDTTFYIYNPLISHNEVGDAPSQLGIMIDDFHRKMVHRQQFNPYSVNASSTHDTKRGEDARMRINVLSEMPEEWMLLVQEWHVINAGFIQPADAVAAPSRNDEYFIYQSLIGSFPVDGVADELFRQRSAAFIVKALREAKVHTTYTQINEAYENACVAFIDHIISYEPFMQRFIPFLRKVLSVASIYSLVQLVVKCTAPGIPDIYQGCELWETSYVDPDNRRAIDYAQRIQWLQVMEAQEPGPGFFEWLQQHRMEGVEKLFVTQKLLHFRHEWRQVFLEGDYIPVPIVNGERKAIAYARRWQHTWVLVIVPVGIAKAEAHKHIHPIWDKLAAELPEGAPVVWRHVFTGQELRCKNGLLLLQEAFVLFPVAVLAS